MKFTIRRMFLRIAILTVSTLMLAMAFSCIERPMKVADPQPDIISDFSAAQSSTRDVDILFMIDTSVSMAGEQSTLLNNFPNLMRVLKDIGGGLPNVHIGVISPDIGAYNFSVPGCGGIGDDAKLLKGSGCSNPIGQNFIVDIEPSGCSFSRDEETGICSNSTCSQANCEQDAFSINGTSSEPAGLTLYSDDNGCPRCRNYSGEDLEQVFTCMADIGTGGCGFEQHLEAVTKALSGNHNPGFLRDNAYLAVFIISDEDDCSAKSPGTIFDNSDTSLEGNLGPLDNFRCLEFGLVCDQTWNRFIRGGSENYTGCHSRSATDANNLLKPVSQFTNLLKTIKSPEMIIAGAITGPNNNGNLSIGLNGNNNPDVNPVCAAAGDTDGAAPGIRLYEFISEFISNENDLSWAFTSICNNDYSGALEGLGEKIKALVEVQCITTPLKGCPDPAAFNGQTPLTELPRGNECEEGKPCADVCEANCSVNDLFTTGERVTINMCPQDYNGGHPEKRDPNLPVNQCWHVRYNEKCADPDNNFGPSRGAEIVISRRSNPMPGTRASITCAGFPLIEQLCQDDIDNDFDGLKDCEDPDCQFPGGYPSQICPQN
ncbi:hypothetical protein KKF34_01570 [Myxococcota bacterium]|nr:hypothetical protein [Myxococcota bacterium]MBU1380089.1 hypothetical protein [Myxococcota bacterium]MBU1495547.1 hypothetical protein [Myxococcota bacterium]